MLRSTRSRHDTKGRPAHTYEAKASEQHAEAWHAFKTCCSTSCCCGKELRPCWLCDSRSSRTISALAERAAAASNPSSTSNKNLVTTFEVARGTKGVKAGWLAVLGPHVPPFAASVDQEEAVVSCKHHANPPTGELSSAGVGSYLRLN